MAEHPAPIKAPSSLLLRGARAGSAEALNDLLQKVCPRVLALIRLRLGPDLRRRVDSQDILQTTLIKAFRRIDQFEGSGSNNLLSWLAAIAANEVRDHANFHQRARRDINRDVAIDDKVTNLAADFHTAIRRLELQERALKLESALERLSELHREVLILRHYEDLSFPEIGQRLEKTPDACRMLFARAMTALTREMRDEPTDSES